MTATLKIEWSGLENALSEIDFKLDYAKASVVDDLTYFGQGAKDEMVRTHTFQNRTFRLERSIDYDIIAFTPENPARGVVFALTEYASDVEFGIPGRSRPYPFFWPVYYKWLALLEEKLSEDWPRAFHG